MADNNKIAKVIVSMDVQQAERQLQLLNKSGKEVKDEMQAIQKLKIQGLATPEQLTRLRELGKEYRQIRKDAKELKVQLGDVSKVLNNLSSAPVKAIRDAIKTTTAQMERLDRSTEQYAKKQKELAVLRAELDKINSSANKASSGLSQIGQTMKRLATYVLVYAGFNKLTEGIQKMYGMNVALSDQLSDIEKTTGLSGQSLANLSDQILRIDTRTPVEQLNNLAVAAGKLGISAEEDVMGFVRAGNIINVALGEDLGDDAINNLAKLNDILGITKRLGVEQALLATGSAINELGQSSTANEGYLVDFAQRMGGIAAQAGLTIQQVLALGSASDQLGQNVEVSATALNKVITTLVSQTGQVAKAIGVTKQELQSALDAGTWEGLMLVFEKLAGKGGLAAIAPLMGDLGSDGARLNQVISALTSDTGRLTRELNIANDAFAKGTSVVDEYNKKNNNLAGTIEKIGKNVKYWFMGSGIIDWMLKVSKTIEQITRRSESLLEQFQNQKRATNNLTSSLSPLLDQIDKLKDSQSADEQKRLSEIMQQVGQSIPEAVTWMDRYGKILGINTERARAFIEEQKNAMQVLNKGAIVETEKKLYELKKQEVVLEEIVNEISQKGSFTSSQTIQTSTFGTSQTILFEEDSQEKINEKQKELVSVQEEIERTKSLLRTLTGETLEDMQKVAEETTKATVAIAESDKEQKERIQNQMNDIDLWLQQKKNALSEARLAEQDANSESYISQEEYNRSLEKLEIEAMQKRLAILGLEPNEVAKIEGQILDIRRQFMEKTETAQKKWADEYEKLQSQLGIRTEDKDKQNLARINVLYDTLIQKAREGVEANYKSQEQITEDIRMFEEQRQKVLNNYYANKDLEYLDEEEAKEAVNIRERFINREMDYEEYQRQMNEMELQYAEVRTKITDLEESKKAELVRKYHEQRFKSAKQSYDKEKKLQQQYATVIQSSLEGIGGAFAQLASGSENSMEQMRDAIVDTLFDTLTQMVDIWLTELGITATASIAQGTMKEIGSKGLIGLATGAAITGIVHGLLAVAKSAIKSALKGKSANQSSGSTGQRVVKTSGFSVGGSTGDGPAYEVAGVVHKGEYVVPKWQMQDPVSFNYVRALETIRQTRSHENILSIRRSGYADGGAVQTPEQTVPRQSSDPQMIAVMQEMYALLSSLRRDGVKTVFSVSRLEQTQARLNASRLRGSLKK